MVKKVRGWRYKAISLLFYFFLYFLNASKWIIALKIKVTCLLYSSANYLFIWLYFKNNFSYKRNRLSRNCFSRSEPDALLSSVLCFAQSVHSYLMQLVLPPLFAKILPTDVAADQYSSNYLGFPYATTLTSSITLKFQYC